MTRPGRAGNGSARHGCQRDVDDDNNAANRWQQQRRLAIHTAYASKTSTANTVAAELGILVLEDWILTGALLISFASIDSRRYKFVSDRGPVWISGKHAPGCDLAGAQPRRGIRERNTVFFGPCFYGISNQKPLIIRKLQAGLEALPGRIIPLSLGWEIQNREPRRRYYLPKSFQGLFGVRPICRKPGPVIDTVRLECRPRADTIHPNKARQSDVLADPDSTGIEPARNTERCCAG